MAQEDFDRFVTDLGVVADTDLMNPIPDEMVHFVLIAAGDLKPPTYSQDRVADVTAWLTEHGLHNEWISVVYRNHSDAFFGGWIYGFTAEQVTEATLFKLTFG
jgi:hypothetical protein